MDIVEFKKWVEEENKTLEDIYLHFHNEKVKVAEETQELFYKQRSDNKRKEKELALKYIDDVAELKTKIFR